MPIELCRKCNRLHYLPGACPEPKVVVYRSPEKTVSMLKGEKSGESPKKSTAARKDVQQGGAPERSHSTGTPSRGAAGTQAPPVDTLKQAEAAAAHLAPNLTKRGTPRQRAPKGTFDRKAYQRDAARERRARLKAEKTE